MKKFVCIIITVSLFASCNVNELDFDNIEVQPITGVFSFPLGETTYLMRDILTKQTGDSLDLLEDSTSLFTLQYFDTITYNAPDDFIQINDITESGSISSVPTANGPITINFGETFVSLYDPQNGEQLDSVFYESGDLTITTNSSINGTVDYNFTISNTTRVDNGTPISLGGSIPAGVGSDTQSASLEDYKTSLTDMSGDNRYIIIFDVEVTLATGDMMDPTDDLSFDLTYGNQTFSLIYGKFGQDTVQVGDQSIEIDFFSQAAREGITFGNPSLTFDFRNSFGVPVEVDFSGLSGQDAEGNQTFLTGDIVRNPRQIDGSDVNTPTRDATGETVQSIIEINNTNSNIIQLFGSSPERLLFDVIGRSNPDDVTALNYLHAESQLTANVQLEVPMEIQLENFQESGFFSLDGGVDLENIDSAFIRVVTINELPFSGTATLEIQDADSTTLYIAADNIILKAPLINIQGVVTDPGGSTADIPLSQEGVDALAIASHVKITLTLNTPVSQTSREIYVKVLADYTLELKVGIGGKFNLEL
ncbi:hypothetical protein [Ekhidna sp.]